MNIVLFSEEEIKNPLNINDTRANHILQILHKKTGDFFDAGIINGQAGTAKIISVTDKELSFEFTPETDGKPLYPLTMIIGFPRPIQLKRLLRDIASLGVNEVHLCGTELGEKSYLKSTLSEPENAFEMLKDGSVQAKSTHVPNLFIHQSLAACLAHINQNKTTNSVLVGLDNVQPVCPLMKHPDFQKKATEQIKSQGVIAAIGSERGWTDNERELLKKNGFTLCSMGTRVLRTETACTTAVSLILSKLEVI